MSRLNFEALATAFAVTFSVGLITRIAPGRWHTSLVGVVFLAAVWCLVWRHDDEHVRRAGLALGGLVIPGELRPWELARNLSRALSFAGLLALVVAVPFFFLWRWWWTDSGSSLSLLRALRPFAAGNEVMGQVFVIALPEEAFYRGYLQSRLDEVWGTRFECGRARVGPALFISAAIFAVGHVVTVNSPARLAVFFPAILFGWLRARTGGIGASVFFHAFCNLYSEALGSAYGVYSLG
jgi:hypothetical protein